MDQVPLPSAGNRLTVREYQHRWLDLLSFVTGQPVLHRLAAVPPEMRFLAGLPPTIDVDTEPLEIAFPVLGRAVVAPPAPCESPGCGVGASAIVYGQAMQPILAVADGVVTAIQYGHPITGGVTVTLVDQVGRTYHYAGFNDDSPGTDDGAAHHSFQFTALAQLGMPVFAGQVLGYMGDTDPMPSDEHRGTGDGTVWPHLRLTILDVAGRVLDADSLVVAAQQRQACHVAYRPMVGPRRSVAGSARGLRALHRQRVGDRQRRLDAARQRHDHRLWPVGADRRSRRLRVGPGRAPRPRRTGQLARHGMGTAVRRSPPSSGVAGSGADGFSPTACCAAAETPPALRSGAGRWSAVPA